MLSLETLLSLVTSFEVWTLTLTSPDDLPVDLLAASLMPMPTSSMPRIAPPAHSRGVFRCENWLLDGREENKSPRGEVSTVMLLLMNSV